MHALDRRPLWSRSGYSTGVGGATTIPTSTAGQRGEIHRLLKGLGLPSESVQLAHLPILAAARIDWPEGTPLRSSLTRISNSTAQRLIKHLRGYDQ